MLIYSTEVFILHSDTVARLFARNGNFQCKTGHNWKHNRNAFFSFYITLECNQFS